MKSLSICIDKVHLCKFGLIWLPPLYMPDPADFISGVTRDTCNPRIIDLSPMQMSQIQHAKQKISLLV